MLFKSYDFRRLPKLLAAALAIGIAVLAPAARAGDPPPAPAQSGEDSGERTFEIGEAKIHWHLAPGSEVSPRTAELIESYRRLVAQRWSGEGEKKEPPQPAKTEVLANGIPFIRVPPRFVHTMSVRVDAEGELVPFCADATAAPTVDGATLASDDGAER